MKNPREEN